MLNSLKSLGTIRNTNNNRMNVSELQADKLDLIAWITEMHDASLIAKLKSIQKDNIEIPRWQIEEVNKRLAKLDNNPEQTIDFDKMLLSLKEKHGL